MRIKNTSNNVMPKYATVGSAGFDIRSNEDVAIKAKERVVVGTGLYFEVPKGTEAQIRPRSGLAAKYGITVLNTPGTIDSDYRGEVKVILYNTSNEDFKIKEGDRIAQVIISPYVKVDLENTPDLSITERGEGGLGSTGIK